MVDEQLDIKPPVDVDNPNFYLDKNMLNDALRKYRDSYNLALKNNEELPGVPEYIGDCFLKIANGLAMKHNFRNYSFLNDMISDAVINCLKYVKSYDPDRINPTTNEPTSALSYFTQGCYYAFLGRIKLEAKQTKLKRALLYSYDIDTYSTQVEDDGEFQISITEFLASLGKDEVQEILVEKKPKESKPGPLDEFFG